METAMKLRRQVLNDGRSIRSLSKETGISRNTIRKYVRDDHPPSYQRKEPAVLHKLKEYEGDSHDAQGAADHLRLKYRRGKRYASSAEEFIDRLASESSWSGKTYYIVCPDTGEHISNTWLHAALEAHRAE